VEEEVTPEEPGHKIGSALDEPRLRRLMEVGRSLVSQLDLEAILQDLLETAREITGARYAALGILAQQQDVRTPAGTQGGTEIDRFLAVGIDDETRQRIGELPRGRGVLGVLIDDPVPIRLDDVGSHPRSFGFPAGHPPMKSFLGVPILVREQAYGNLYLAEKEGGPFDQADEEAAVLLAEYAGIAIENARLYAGAVERRHELERAVGRLEATSEVARAVGGETDIDRVLETIVKRARALVEARSLVILLEDRGELEVAATAGEFERDVRGERLRIGWTTWGGILRGLRPERIADVRSRLGLSARELGVDAKAALLVPLNFRGEALGVIAAFDRLSDPPDFDQEDEQLMLAFGASAATAVATAQSVAEGRLRDSIDAGERERGRWARELHDDTLQGLGALRVTLGSARTGSPEELEDAVNRAIIQLGDEIASLRGLITELRPAVLDELGLEAAIETLIDHHSSASDLEIDQRIELGAVDRDAISPELERTVYRVVQEALTNVAKHAEAQRVAFELEVDDGRLRLRIRDDGAGFDPSKRPRDAFGLVGMRERIELAFGELEIRSEPGSGTDLRATIPLTGRPQEVRRSA
jgi:signal transduction histidine kinase